VDIAAAGGAPISAPADGIVTFEGWTPYGGIAICTSHDPGIESCAYHAAATFVDVGDRVTRGQHIGEVGMSGLAAGPHVHWQVRVDGVLVNPLRY
jgi:murein DD-endopeptidase MepM/ murein hydrolase activator NlpD